MTAFEQLLKDLKALSINKAEQGARFEKLIKQFLLTDRLYAEQYEKVWLWAEFPYRSGHDIGIDLVAKRHGAEEYCAIQCKFYDESHSVSKDDVDTFLSASGKMFMVDGKWTWYSERLIVSTTDKWGQNAEETIKGQNPPVNRLRLQDLQESSIDWKSFSLANPESMQRSQLKQLRPHQKRALDDVVSKFKTAERGKLIMACGTGKTFTSLRIAEAQTNGKGNVLFLVPSISLLNQSLTEWSAQCVYDYHVYAICSDPKASKTNGDSIVDTAIPATTDVQKLIARYHLNGEDGLHLFFSTYQSIEVVAKLQKKAGFVFDLIVCDEAHRTTGVTLVDEDESAFVRVHSNDFIQAKRRLYMTATPRIYGDESKQKADNKNAVLCSMDDETIYGEELHRLGFSDSVEQGLLSDYKVLVLAVDENYVNRSLQRLITEDGELRLDDAVKIVGCLNGLSKKTLFDADDGSFATDPAPMRRAVAFCSTIEGSKKFVAMLQTIQDEYKMNGYDERIVTVEAAHVDGKSNALFRKEKIDWLKADPGENHCRVLSNARYLSEGIDVPALDAVMFLNPRKSIVDIVQSVGRVMRKTEGKKFGYIILPIGIPAGMEPEEALADNEKYKIVWDVLQALRAHDDRFNNTINKIELNKKKPDNISIIGVSGGEEGDGEQDLGEPVVQQIRMDFSELENWKNCIYAKIVKKCGSRQYWETWAKDIATIAERHIAEIRVLLENEEIAAKFRVFLDDLRSNLNPSISEDDAIEMLAEHMITRPVFNALFDNYEFIQKNPVSIIMQEMLDTLHDKALEKEQETLDKFYHSVQERAKGLDNAKARQTVIIELYEQFFKNALPKQVAKLGIVYTPVEVVDFIINSVNEVLKQKFGCSLSDRDVHVLDPFTGTGTFIVQLLRSGLIRKEDLLYKYTSELHANEIVLLAYYIAAINIEETFHELYGAEEYTPFEGIVLTDTFEMTENVTDSENNRVNKAALGSMFECNSERAQRQLDTPIRVIIGNPPYSVGQKSGNDNNQNMSYANLDASVAKTYVHKSKAALTRNAYDTYIKAFRWATDRIGDNGVIGFVTNGAFLDAVALDGFRQCLLEDFNSVYCFNLRGNQRTSGELSRKEGGKIFGSGSRASVCITVLVKKKGVRRDGYVHYHDIGDYLSREQKLDIIKNLGNINQITWESLIPDENGDWLNKRNPNFINFMAVGDKKKKEKTSIWNDNYSVGLSTSRDAWVYSYSKDQLSDRMSEFISFYNEEVRRCHGILESMIQENLNGRILTINPDKVLMELRCNDAKKTNWSAGLLSSFNRKIQIDNQYTLKKVMQRPFCKQYLYYNKRVIERPSRWESVFPTEQHKNLIICVSGAPLKKAFSILMTDTIQDLHLLENSQGVSQEIG